MNVNTKTINTKNDQNEGVTALTGTAARDQCITQQQVSFFDADPGNTYTVPSQLDSTFDIGNSDVTDIQDFLRRPVEIASITLDDQLTFTSTSINPWELFYNNAAVKNKLQNFTLLRSNLNVKFVVNAGSSWWGMPIVAYAPLTNLRPTETFTSLFSEADCMKLSQRPHIYLDLGSNKGGCLCLPFFHPNSWLQVSDMQQFTDMGRLDIGFLPESAPRNTTSPTSTTCEISIFAWADDVSLSQTTEVAALQADEYATGPISSVASSVAQVSGRLVSVPFLQPYAKATQLAATAIGKIAHIFGFSRTPVIDNPGMMKNMPFGLTANCGTHEIVEKLTIDPKQELCIDSRTVGLDGTDEMGIYSIAKRESYLTTAFWQTNDTSGEVLKYFYVNPMYRHPGVFASDTWVDFPAMSFASHPFKYWRGSITYRIVVVCTKFHRGRLLIQWDPLNGANTSTSNTNIVASKVVDIAANRDITFTVPYAAITPYLEIDKDMAAQNFGFDASVAPDPLYHNGTLSIKVLNPISSISDSNGAVIVHVFVKAGEDFEVATPDDLGPYQMVTAGISLQGDVIAPDADVGEQDNFAPVSTSSTELVNTVMPIAPPINDVCMGENLSSFRQLLKRYNYSRVQAFDAGSGSATLTYFKTIMSRWPLPVGRMDDGVDTFLTGPGNITNLTLFNYLQGAFVGMRGSSRWKIDWLSRQQPEEIIVHRTPTQLGTAGYSQVNTVPSGTNSRRMFQSLPDINFAGYSLTNCRTQTGVEIDAPHYSKKRLISSSPYAVPLGTDADATREDSITVRAVQVETIDSDRTYLTMHHAVGDDFSFFFYLNAPRVYTNSPLPPGT